MKKQRPTYSLGSDFQDKLNKFVNQFVENGFDFFKEEFKNIDKFIEMASNDKSERDDHSLRQSKKEEYLLEMVSFKIYDQLNREKFNNCKNTLIILPDCLSIHEKECEKVEYKYGYVCRKCQENCQAYQVVELAKKYKAKVLFSKRKLTEQLEHHHEKMGDMGVIGIACIMMLASGMRTAQDVGVPARGVLLNFTGCDHWNDEPFASQFSMEQLENILKEKYGT
jgi:hypothetical protein